MSRLEQDRLIKYGLALGLVVDLIPEKIYILSL